MPSAPSGILRALDEKKMQLSLEGRIARVMYFGEADIWFEAKPLVLYLEYNPSHVSQTLTLVKEKHKKSLKELLDTRGQPKMVELSDRSTPGYHELKSLYISEPGLYSLIFRSTKKQAQEFQDWVYEDVLTTLRRQGSYSIGKAAQSGELLEWLKREDEREQRLEARMIMHFQGAASTVLALQQGLAKRDEELSEALRRRDAAQARALAELQQSILSQLSAKFSGFVLAIAGHVSSTVTAAVAAGLALKKAQPKKKTTNAAEMPEDQRATPLQAGPLSLGLATVALERFPEMPFAAWRKIRGSFGHHAKKERLRLHALGERHAEYVDAPLLWAYTGSASTVEGGGARYVFCAQLPTTRAQRAAGAPAPTESLEQRVHRLAAGLSAEEKAVQWPIHVAELEPQWNEGDDEGRTAASSSQKAWWAHGTEAHASEKIVVARTDFSRNRSSNKSPRRPSRDNGGERVRPNRVEAPNTSSHKGIPPPLRCTP